MHLLEISCADAEAFPYADTPHLTVTRVAEGFVKREIRLWAEGGSRTQGQYYPSWSPTIETLRECLMEERQGNKAEAGPSWPRDGWSTQNGNWPLQPV